MKIMRMSHLALYLGSLWIAAVAQIQPLPSVDRELVAHFQLALDAVFGIGIRLEAFLEDDNKDNFLVSPISATVVVGQLLLGAEGEFREQLVELLSLPNKHLYENEKFSLYGRDKNITYNLPYSTLHLQLSSLLKALESGPSATKHFILKQKSAVFVDDRIALKNDFLRNLRNFYMTRLHRLDFATKPVVAQKYINTWASRSTNGLINTVLGQPPPPETASIFANAVYFKAEWEIPFSDELNRGGPFNVNPNKQVEVTYMIGLLEQILYAESQDYRIIALPYKNDELGMYIIMPKPDNQYIYDIKNFGQSLKSSEVLDTITKARRRNVVVKIPKMTLSYSFSILDQLKKYRVFKRNEDKMNITSRSNVVDTLEEKVEAFNNFTTSVDKDIYLTNAASDKNLRIDDIVQQVIITVNEKGTEAAAVTLSTIDYMGGAKNFIVDRPFIFFIRHEATSATLFWGTITNPSS